MKKLIGGLLVAGIAILTAPQAEADSGSYLNRIYNNDLVDFTGAPAPFLNAGYRVCTDISAGFTRNQIVNALYWGWDFDWTAAEEVYYLAAEELC